MGSRRRRRSTAIATVFLCCCHQSADAVAAATNEHLASLFPNLPDGFHGEGDSVSVAVGPHHTCALERRPGVDFGGAARCWGMDDWGQSSPPEDGMFIQLSAGDAQTCGVRLDSRIVCWGMLPHEPPGRFQQVSVGANHACALTEAGAINCWGNNAHGRCDAPEGADFVQVAAGSTFTCALRRNGVPQCWGKNHVGQACPPQHLQLRQIAASNTDHACGITVAGSSNAEPGGDLVCWGRNKVGEAVNRAGPWRQVTCGHWSTCAIREEEGAGAECWGKRSASIPNEELEELVTSWDHTCSVNVEGEVSCWGDADGSEVVPDGFQLA
jgi:alpha-tubulin suppressor-like RCC1 family protein